MSAPPSAAYAACRNLCYAVLAQGLQDAVNGDPAARDWVHGRAFTYWCDWVDVDPIPLRRRLQDLAPRRFVIRHAPPGCARGPRRPQAAQENR